MQIGENGEIAADSQAEGVQEEEVSADILEQALVEATEGLQEGTVQFSTENVSVADDSVSHSGHIETTTITQADLDSGQYRLVAADGTEIQHAVPVENSITQQQSLLKPGLIQGVNITNPSEEHGNNVLEHHSTQAQQMGQTRIVQVSANSVNSSAPLGSSQNPIRIVQQGNQYTSVQQLNPIQLQQIMQVVQQQQLAKETQGQRETVLFNPNTKTKIVYKVLYPSELHKHESEESTHNSGATQVIQQSPSKRQVIQIPSNLLTVNSAERTKRTYRKRVKVEEEEKLDVPELSRAEKEAKKNAKPKTRSGRAVKPPKHMIKVSLRAIPQRG